MNLQPREPALRRLGRRLLTFPAIVGLALVSLLASPLWVPALALADRLAGGERAALRCGALAAWYLHCETLGLLLAGGLWLVSGGGRNDPARWQARHFALEAWWASLLYRGAVRVFDVRVEVEGLEAAQRTPFLLFPRHASLGDTLLPGALLSGPLGIRLRYVLKRELLFDPCLDLVGHRIPNVFVDRRSAESEREIAAVAALARGLGEGDGVLIYPEGTRFTPARRERILGRLRERAPDRARRFAALERVLPPRSGGALALVDAAPGVDVVFCAHTGLEDGATIGGLWRGGLLRATVRVRFWRVPAARIPKEHPDRVEWLAAQWERMDACVGELRRRSGGDG